MTIDSNILIAYLTGEASVVSALSEWKECGELLILPTVVEAEILSFGRWTEQERRRVESLLENEFFSVVFDRSVARIAARLRRERTMKLPDAAIAATALYTNSPLITRNVRDFKHVPELQVIQV